MRLMEFGIAALMGIGFLIHVVLRISPVWLDDTAFIFAEASLGLSLVCMVSASRLLGSQRALAFETYSSETVCPGGRRIETQVAAVKVRRRCRPVCVPGSIRAMTNGQAGDGDGVHSSEVAVEAGARLFRRGGVSRSVLLRGCWRAAS